MKPETISYLSALSICLLLSSASADWVHYRGPAYNGLATEKLAEPLPPAGPKQLWKAALGIGTSAVTVSGDRAYSMGNVGGKDVVYCLDAATGKEIWRHTYTQELEKRMFEGGPAATPTVDGGRVYSVSHQGDLFCLEASTGRGIWYKHYQKDFGGRRPQWGFAGSPTVEGNLLICDVGAKGASTVALDKSNGQPVWKSGGDGAGYGSPVVATISGRRTVVVFKAEHVIGLDLANGRELWRSRWKTSYEVNAATPLVVGDKVFISSGYGSGCALIAVSGNKATELWRNKNLKAHINTPVAVGGFVYGIDGQAGGSAPLVCLDLAGGKVQWEERNVSGGALIAADGKLIILTERGELVIGNASPAGFKAAMRTQVLGGRCWVQPTLAGGKLFAKNNQGELVCLQLAP